jgi:hypothetical protein
VYVLGASHVSQVSCRQIKELIRAVRPEVGVRRGGGGGEGSGGGGGGVELSGAGGGAAGGLQVPVCMSVGVVMFHAQFCGHWQCD